MRSKGYLVVVEAGDDLKCFARTGRDGLLWKSPWMGSPTVFSDKQSAQRLIDKTKKVSSWVKKFKVRFRLQSCVIVTEVVK